MLFLGIDAGKGGAVAWMDEEHRGIEVHDTPLLPSKDYNRRAMLDLLMRAIVRTREQVIITLEQVHSMPKDGKVQAFAFGRGYGYWEMACTAVGTEPNLVRPEAWKRMLLLGLGKGKQVAVDHAARLFPNMACQLYGPRGGLYDDRAEALLLCEVGIRTWKMLGRR